VRHGTPSHVVVELWQRPHELRLTIEDDGRGIDERSAARTGMGLRIMRYRARAVGGTLEVERRPGGGTRVLMSLVLPGGDA